jgi:class 3 adenylate cyclase/pimeloyl-ACP methyl ester carboxylesterase
MEREVRYCRAEDGIQIAYSISGAGPALLVCPLFYNSFAAEDRYTPEHGEFIRALGVGRTVIRYDARGTGLSQRDLERLDAHGLSLDMQAVAAAAGVDTYDVYAYIAAGPSAILHAAAHPDRVSHLILFASYSRIEDVLPAEQVAGFSALMRSNWQLASQLLADMSVRETGPDLGLGMGAAVRNATSGNLLATAFEDKTDVADAACTLRCPVLLLHGEADQSVPLSASQRLAGFIPDARLVPLEGGSNYPPLADWRHIVALAREFLTPTEIPLPEPGASGSPALRTVLFTDLVGHTEMMSRLGDDAGRTVLREHEDITRRVLKENSGTEVKTMGDGFMASFGSVTKAVECAVALQRAFAEREGQPLAVRVGLNAGEPIEEDGDLFGATVILASRIAAKADAGEILVADTVRGLCSGKGFLFADRGEFVAKGFEEPVRVYEVSWRG